MPGTRLTVTGRVLSPDCSPLAGAELDVWQADDDGRYDNDGVNDPVGGAYILRGRMTTDEQGRYSFQTVLPGHYLNGAQYRPAHIHVTVSADGHLPLTTQLYFEGDPYNDVDGFIVDSLIMPVADVAGQKECTFDFVLPAL
jgi:protocatechuate 3,4-dioxygenase beta subunit